MAETTDTPENAETEGADAKSADRLAADATEERIASAARRGRQVGTIFMVVFGAWFVLATVYNFAMGVFGPAQ